MYICVDIGNTNIVCGIYNENILIKDIRFGTNRQMTVDEYGIKLLQLIHFNGIEKNDIEGAIVSSVVPELDEIIKIMFQKYFNVEALFVGQGVKSGINIKLDNPKQLGADLLAGAVGATFGYGAPVLVIDIGTALTITYVNSNKEFLGGAIMPGIRISFSNLVSKTSKLEDVGIEDIKDPLGKDTKTCIQSGMIYGWSSMIDGMIDKYYERLGDFKVIITGGEARFLLKHLKHEVIYDENLLLTGLSFLYQKNKK